MGTSLAQQFKREQRVLSFVLFFFSLSYLTRFIVYRFTLMNAVEPTLEMFSALV